jgi:hypothetical protein
VDNHSPNASGIQAWQVKIKPHPPAWRAFFSPLTDSSSSDLELFSDMAREHSLTTRQFGKCLEKLVDIPVVYCNHNK